MGWLMKTIKDCMQGNHSLTELCNADIGSDEKAILRWCKICGAVVIDVEVDGRLYPGELMKMHFPQLFKEKFE